MPTGSGKTRVTLLWLRKRKPDLTWIICPSSAVKVWQDEIERWLGEQSTPIIGIRNEKISDLLDPPTRYVILTYSTFRSIAVYSAKATYPDAVVLDESHKIKNPRAQVTKAVHKYLIHAQYKAILTATPMESPLDLWAQWFFLDKGQRLGPSFYGFRQNFFQPDSMGWNWESTDEGEKYFNYVIRDTGVVMKEGDLDLPPRTYQKHYVEMTRSQKKHYDELSNEFQLHLKDEMIIDTQWAMVKFGKMRQILSGFIKDDKGKYHTLATEKRNALAELLKELTPKHKVVVWCSFTREILDIMDMLNVAAIGFVLYYGEMTPREREDAIHEFQTDKSVLVFVAQIAAGSEAISLTAADTAIFYSNGYSMRIRKQAEGRTRRIGSEGFKRINYIDLVTQDSYEEDLIDLLRDKKMRTKRIVYRHLTKKLQE